MGLGSLRTRVWIPGQSSHPKVALSPPRDAECHPISAPPLVQTTGPSVPPFCPQTWELLERFHHPDSMIANSSPTKPKGPLAVASRLRRGMPCLQRPQGQGSPGWSPWPSVPLLSLSAGLSWSQPQGVGESSRDGTHQGRGSSKVRPHEDELFIVTAPCSVHGPGSHASTTWGGGAMAPEEAPILYCLSLSLSLTLKVQKLACETMLR